MITVSILGLDQFVIGDYSAIATSKIAQLYECEEDEINFYAPSSFVFHNGVDQSTYNVIVRIHAEEKYQPLEKLVARYIMDTLSKMTIHMTIQFFYYKKEHCYEYINDDYPLYMNDANLVQEEENFDESEDDEEKEAEIYEGNIFANLDEKIEAKRKEAAEKDDDSCSCHDDNCDFHHNH